jgi:Protein of unknown function (DUF1488)
MFLIVLGRPIERRLAASRTCSEQNLSREKPAAEFSRTLKISAGRRLKTKQFELRASACRRPIARAVQDLRQAGAVSNTEERTMTLKRAGFQRFDDDRMVVLFTMTNASTDVPCAISSAAMDQLEGSAGTKPSQREDQFLRLRDKIEERASRKFNAAELEGNPPGIILRSIDFR